jgi:hypothetical protein
MDMRNQLNKRTQKLPTKTKRQNVTIKQGCNNIHIILIYCLVENERVHAVRSLRTIHSFIHGRND